MFIIADVINCKIPPSFNKKKQRGVGLILYVLREIMRLEIN